MPQRLIIEFNRADALYWRDLWRYRELFGVLAWRDLSVRYKETVFGVSWALVRPLLTMLVFTAIFGRLAKLPSDGNVPYPLMVLVGMIRLEFVFNELDRGRKQSCSRREPDYKSVLPATNRPDGVHCSKFC